MDYVPKYFKPYELLSEHLYTKLTRGGWSDERIWQVFFDPRTLAVNDLLRKRYGKMIANTWWHPALVDKYGFHQYRGFREPACSIGAKWSQHRFGRASDLDPVEVTVEEIRHDIKNGENFHHITCIEENVSWLHHDERNYKGLLIVYP